MPEKIADNTIKAGITGTGGEIVYKLMEGNELVIIDYSKELYDGDGTPNFQVIEDVSDISVSETSSMIVKTDGSLWGRGNNCYGQLGDGTIDDKEDFVHIMDDVMSVSLGKSHCLAITSDKSLYSWGLNNDGQLGIEVNEENPSLPITKPVKVAEDVIWISSGTLCSFFITADNKLWGLGAGGLSLTIGGAKQYNYEPLFIMDNMIAVKAYKYHMMALDRDGILWGWGNNNRGQLGVGMSDPNGKDADEYMPVKIMDGIEYIGR